ncbi:MAG: peptidoglycan DD-metalloendopeptidase family protein [Desulfobulbaceae bacterium]|nr:peptidoglycan DD-metalloendopeptidase family protein [Desulfobulbaceae bacterium]
MTDRFTTTKNTLKKIIGNIRFSAILVAIIFAGSAVLGNLHMAEQDQSPSLRTLLDRTNTILHNSQAIAPQAATPSVNTDAYACVAPSQEKDPPTTEIAGTIKRGETFDSSLRRQNVSKDIRLSLIAALRPELDFKQIKPEDNYLLQLDDNGDLASFSYESSPLDVLTIKNSDDGYQVSKAPIELERKKVKITGEISSSLFSAFSEQNEDMRLVYAFADIFSSKIDFNTEIQPGDRFSLVVDKYYKNGELVGYGKIDAAQYYRTKGQTLEAYRHVSPSGKEEYYDKNGLAAGTAFLRSPVPVGKLSSKFTYQRRHPITGRIKPHLGIDLSAPTGTAIMAVADGKVVDMGRNGGFGNQITLSHAGDYKTYYGHLSGFKKGLHRGSLVSKKDIIGYVGSTGMSTGPHLDYRVQHHTVFQDPFGMTIKTEIALAGKDLRQFKQEVEEISAMANFASFTTHPQVLKVSNLTITKEHKITLL